MYINKVNLFDLDTQIVCNEEISRSIRNKLYEMGHTVKSLSRCISISDTAIYHFLNGNSMKPNNLKELIKFLGISVGDIEKSEPLIRSGPNKFKFNFPIELTPLNIRVVSHFLGDCCLEKYGCRWTQKSKIGGENMIKLIESLVSFKIKRGTKNTYGIPILLGDIVAKALDIKRNELKSSIFVNRVHKLPKEFKIQLLAAFIVDEGHVRKSTIQISNTDLELLQKLKKLCVSLGYPCSKIIEDKRKDKTRMIKGEMAQVNHQPLTLFMYADGLLKFKKDLDNMIIKYGTIMGLWQKQDELIKYSKVVDLNKVYKGRVTKQEIIPLILNEIAQGPINISEFSKENNLENYRVNKIFRRLCNRNIIKRISVGDYTNKPEN